MNFENCVKLFRVEIENELSLEKYISTLSERVHNQLNAISSIQKFKGFKEK